MYRTGVHILSYSVRRLNIYHLNIVRNFKTFVWIFKRMYLEILKKKRQQIKTANLLSFPQTTVQSVQQRQNAHIIYESKAELRETWLLH